MSVQLQQILCILLLLIGVLFFHSRNNTQLKKEEDKNYRVLWLVAVLFSLFYCSGYDYFSYKKNYEDYIFYGFQGAHMEQIYYWTMNIAPFGYLSWRILIWGLAAFVWILVCKELKCSGKYAGLVILVMPLFQYFYYLREALPFGMMLLGICKLQSDQKNIRNRIFAYALLVASAFLHKSIILYIFLYLLSRYVPFNKVSVILSLLAVPLLRKVVDVISHTFLGMTLFTDTLTSQYGNVYLAQETVIDYNFGGYLRLFLTYFPIVYAIVYYSIVINRKGFNDRYSKLVSFSYYIMYLFLLFWDNVGHTNMALRFFATSCVPVSFFMAYRLSQQNFIGKQERVIIYSSVVYIVFTLLLTIFFFK